MAGWGGGRGRQFHVVHCPKAASWSVTCTIDSVCPNLPLNKSRYRQILSQIAAGSGDIPYAHPPECWDPAKKATTGKDLDWLRVIPVDASEEELLRRARAMAHRRYLTGGACVELHGRRFYIPFDDAMRDAHGS